MGTNYYLRINNCEPCGRYDQIHVGKSSAGWSFGFRGHLHKLMNDQHPDWGYDHQSPFGYPITSRADWAKAFTDTNGHLYDEYGSHIPDPLTWLNNLTPPDDQQIAKEIRHGRERYRGRSDWDDPERFRFTADEFS